MSNKSKARIKKIHDEVNKLCNDVLFKIGLAAGIAAFDGATISFTLDDENNVDWEFSEGVKHD